MNKKIKILCTIGPNSLNKEVINFFKKNNVDIFRINMSHTSLDDLKKNIIYLKSLNVKNICIDTEGAQVRTANIKQRRFIKKGDIVIFTNNSKKKNFFQFHPFFDFKKIKLKKNFKVGFEGLELTVISKSSEFLKAKVLTEGYIETNKGVHFDQNIDLDCLSQKDYGAIEIGKKFNIKYFALSFANNENDVKILRKKIGKKSYLISKIETKKGVHNLVKIVKTSDSILIDRGDLSRYYPIEKIPMIQKFILKKSKIHKKECYIATNLLESMIKNFYPTRAESNDIFSSLESGAKGLVLAAETAIGKYPKECVSFINKCIDTRYRNLKKLKL